MKRSLLYDFLIYLPLAVAVALLFASLAPAAGTDSVGAKKVPPQFPTPPQVPLINDSPAEEAAAQESFINTPTSNVVFPTSPRPEGEGWQWSQSRGEWWRWLDENPSNQATSTSLDRWRWVEAGTPDPNTLAGVSNVPSETRATSTSSYDSLEEYELLVDSQGTVVKRPKPKAKKPKMLPGFAPLPPNPFNGEIIATPVRPLPRLADTPPRLGYYPPNYVTPQGSPSRPAGRLFDNRPTNPIRSR